MQQWLYGQNLVETKILHEPSMNSECPGPNMTPKKLPLILESLHIILILALLGLSAPVRVASALSGMAVADVDVEIKEEDNDEFYDVELEGALTAVGAVVFDAMLTRLQQSHLSKGSAKGGMTHWFKTGGRSLKMRWGGRSHSSLTIPRWHRCSLCSRTYRFLIAITLAR